jgi:TolA-binding protein
LVCALAVVWWWADDREVPSVWEGSLVASDDAPVNFTLAEGTLIELEPRSEVELLHSSADAVKLSLKRGSARFDVAKRRSRRFSVKLGEVEVLVTGTQFRVRRTPAHGGERVRVEVEEGSVEVRRAGEAKVRLTAGERWSTFVGDAHARPSQDRAGGEGGDTSRTDAVGPEDDPTRSDSSSARRPRKRERAGQQEGALELFEQANVARRLGRLREAADLYAELVARHPKDRRAALAAFELGRIRMDSLGDLAGAAEALERALKLDGRRAFAEDALARLVLAQEQLGYRKACESARNR